MWTVLEALNWTQDYLDKHGEQNPRLAAQMLLSQATGLERIQLYTNFDTPLTEPERKELRESIKRRIAGEPLQYIMGKAPFRHLELKVCSGVLIPRPETEVLVDIVLEYLSKTSSVNLAPARILDLCTGTGCIALSLLQESPDCRLTAIDVDPIAVNLTKENADLLKLDNIDLLQVLQADLAADLLKDAQNNAGFDVVVSNPPYIPTALLQRLPAEVADHEPGLALDGGADGLDIFRRIIDQATVLLKPGGLLACELHEDCLDIAVDLVDKALYSDVQKHLDLTARPRFITAIRK